MESDLTDCVSFFESQRYADSRRAPSTVKNTEARGDDVPESIELQSRAQFHRGALRLSPCHRQQFLQVKERIEDS